MLFQPVTLEHKPTSLLAQAAHRLAAAPDQTAVVLLDVDDEHTVSTRAFFQQAARYAAALAQVGTAQGDLVVLILPQGLPVMCTFWGAMMAGAVPSIFPFLTDKLDRDRYFHDVRQLIEHAAVRVVVTDSTFEADLRTHLRGIETLKAVLNVETLPMDASVEAAALLRRADAAKPEDTAFLQHSSGSTGLQKGVMLSHRAVINQVASYSAAIRLQPDDVIVSWLPLYHDMGLIAAFILPLLQGVKLVLMSPFRWVRDPKLLLWAIHRHRGTLCWLPNFAYNFMATRIRDHDLNGLDLSSWRAAINCSEPVYAESHRLFVEKFAPYGFGESALATCYAMAENTFAVTQSRIGSVPRVDRVHRQRIMDEQIAVPVGDADVAAQTFVSCGVPVANCEVYVVDAERQHLPERHVGEVALRSDSMLSGYYRRPDLSADAIHTGWYYTGDMGYLADGELYITGRKKDLIIVGGKNVHPQDIENLLTDVAGLYPGRAVAFGVFNDRLGTEDVAVVAELTGDIGPDDRERRAEISRLIRARIAQNTDVTARHVHLVGPRWLIKTSSGKVARRANRQKFIDDVLKSSSESKHR